MTHSRMAALGVATTALALVAGQGAAQPILNAPIVSPLTPSPARLDSIHGSTTDCESKGVVFSPGGAGYQGSADLFDGPTALILKGEKMADVSRVTIILADGTRLSPTAQSQCPTSSGVALRVVFALPTVSGSAARARLEVMAPEPPKLVANVPAQPKTCVDRITGKPTACPELPAAPAGAALIKIADVQLLLNARPHLDSVTPDTISAAAGATICTGRVVFRGRNMAMAKAVPDSSAVNAGYSHRVVAQTATSITADTTKRCTSGIVSSQIFAGLPLRRGATGALQDVQICDTCADVPRNGGTLGGVFLTHRGN